MRRLSRAGSEGQGAVAEQSWCIVMTAREPLPLVETNVRWHLSAGAREAHVYLDRADDPAAACLRRIDGCRVTLCDAAYWRAKRPRRGAPASQMRRQSVNAADAQEHSRADWIVHLDADEFLWQDRPLAGELPYASELGAELRFPVLERSLPQGGAQRTLFEGVFRRASGTDKAMDAVIHGDLAPFLRAGMFSHGSGKCAVPVGRGFRQMVHESFLEVEGRRQRAPAYVSTTTRLLHFDGVTPLHWLLKLIRYKVQPQEVQAHVLPPHRQAQIGWMVARMETAADAFAAEAGLRRLSPERVARLRGFGLLEDAIRFDPQTGKDLSVRGFDLALVAQEAELLDLAGWSDLQV